MGIIADTLQAGGIPASTFKGASALPGASGNNNPFAQYWSNFGTALANPASTIATGFNALFSSGIGNPISNSALQNAGTVGNAQNNGGDPLTTAVTGKGGLTSSTISDLFLRGVIIILGFIFIAAALSMFKSPAIIQQTGNALKTGAKSVANVATLGKFKS